MIGAVFTFVKRAAIWPAIDCVTAKLAGAGLNDVEDEDGAVVEQFNAQQRRAASAMGDRSLLRARLQHSIMLSFG